MQKSKESGRKRRERDEIPKADSKKRSERAEVMGNNVVTRRKREQAEAGGSCWLLAVQERKKE